MIRLSHHSTLPMTALTIDITANICFISLVIEAQKLEIPHRQWFTIIVKSKEMSKVLAI